MICSKCGAQLRDETKFCGQCGASVGNDSEGASASPEIDASASAPTAAPQQKRPASYIAIAGVVAVVVVGVVVGVFAVLGSSNGSGTQTNPADSATLAQEQAFNNGGAAELLQSYDGTLYAGRVRVPNQQIESSETTPFFGDTDYFHFANGKVYWADYFPGTNGNGPVSLHVANADGSNAKTLAEDVLGPSTFYVLDDYIFFAVYGERAVSFAYINTSTGERNSLPAEINSIEGLCGKRLVVSFLDPSSNSTYASFDPTTKEITDIPSCTRTKVTQRVAVSDAGILISEPAEATLYSLDGSVAWSRAPFSEEANNSTGNFTRLLMDDTSCYSIRETNHDNHDFVIDKVVFSTDERTSTAFTASDISTHGTPSKNGDYAIPLTRDGNSLIVQINKMNDSYPFADVYLYKVSLTDGTAELLQFLPAR